MIEFKPEKIEFSGTLLVQRKPNFEYRLQSKKFVKRYSDYEKKYTEQSRKEFYESVVSSDKLKNMTAEEIEAIQKQAITDLKDSLSTATIMKFQDYNDDVNEAKDMFLLGADCEEGERIKNVKELFELFFENNNLEITEDFIIDNFDKVRKVFDLFFRNNAKSKSFAI